jgi:hypothetical protein
MSSVQPPIKRTIGFAPPLPSPSMDEGVIENVAPDDSIRTGVVEALRGVRLAAAGSRNASVAIFGDMTLSEGGKHVKAHDVTYRITNAALPAVDRARQNLETELTRLRTKTNAPASDNSVRSIHMATELRARLAAMSQTDRLAAIQRSINAGDDTVVAAVLEGALILTGLSELEREHVRQQWRRKRLPDECHRVDQLEKDKVHLDRGGILLMGYQRRCADQTIVEAAKASNDAAQKAIASAGAVTH